MSVLKIHKKKLKIKYLKKELFAYQALRPMEFWTKRIGPFLFSWEDWLPGMEYAKYIQIEPNRKKRLEVLCEAMHGVRLLHEKEKPLLHGDISSRNLIVNFQDRTASWIDWDFLSQEDTLEPSDFIYSSTAYLAPERIFLGKNTRAAEIFSLGAMIYEALLKRRLFSPGKMGLEESRYFTESKCALLGSIDNYGELLTHALHPNPKKRYSSVGELQDSLRRLLEYTE